MGRIESVALKILKYAKNKIYYEFGHFGAKTLDLWSELKFCFQIYFNFLSSVKFCLRFLLFDEKKNFELFRTYWTKIWMWSFYCLLNLFMLTNNIKVKSKLIVGSILIIKDTFCNVFNIFDISSFWSVNLNQCFSRFVRFLWNFHLFVKAFQVLFIVTTFQHKCGPKLFSLDRAESK